MKSLGFKKLNQPRGRGGGKMVSVLVSHSDNVSLNPDEAFHFSCIQVV